MVICKIYQNNTLVFSSENIILNSFSLNRFSSSAVAPEFGNVSAGELLFTIDTSTTQNEVERGDLLTVEFDDTYSIGEFIVTKVAKRQGAFDVTCLDRMIDLDGKANLSGVTFPLTASAFINQVYGTGLGMTVDISANVHNPTIDDPIFEDGITYRQVLSKVCECMGANAWYTDKLNIGWYEDSGVSYTSAEYFSADLSEKGFDVAVEVTDDVTATPVEINDSGITLRIVANPFLANKTSAERTAIATAIKQNIGTVNWYGGSVVVIPELPYLLPNSIVEIDGKAFPVTSVTHGINENVKLESKIQSDDNTYNYDVARDIATVKREVGEMEENNKHFFYRDDSGVHITMVENDYNTGNNIHIDSDSIDVRQGTDVVASFGSLTRIGKQGKSGVSFSTEATTFYDTDGSVAGEINTGATTRKSIMDSFLNLPGSLFDETTKTWKTNPVVFSTELSHEPDFTPYGAFCSAWANNYDISDIPFNIVQPDTKYTNTYTYKKGSTVVSTATWEIEYNSQTNSLDSSITFALIDSSKADRSCSLFIEEIAVSYAYQGSAPCYSFGHDNTATGQYVFIEGHHNVASGKYSHVQNSNNTSSYDNQTVIGKWNDNSDNAFEIGNGTNENNRSNAFEVSWDGKASARIVKVDKGAVGLGGLRTTDSTDFEYPLIKDNGSNIWIGAEQVGSQHHRGRTYLSTGYNGTNGNESIYITVPNASNDGGTAYLALHTGNYTKYIEYQAGDTFSFSNIICPGHITNATKNWTFEIIVPKLTNGLTASINLTSMQGRGINGYLEGTQYLTPGNYTITTATRTNSVRVTVAKSSAYTNATNNTPCNAEISGTITFN